MPRTIIVKNGELLLRDKHIIGWYTDEVSVFGNGAKIGAKREHIGKVAYVVIMDGN
jgi:putative transposon-encoded protein